MRFRRPSQLVVLAACLTCAVVSLSSTAQTADSDTDLSSLARQAELFASQMQSPTPSTSGGLFIFVSLGLPHDVLDQLIDEAARSQAVLVMRGLKEQSLRKTFQAAQAALGKRRVAWIIDPTLFDHHNVDAVPAFALALPTGAPTGCPDAGACNQPSASVVVAGNVSLPYALRYIESHSSALAPMAHAYLVKLKTSAR